MYNSKELIMDKDLTFLSYNQCINDEFTIEEILKSPLWITDYTPIFEDVGVTGQKNNNWYIMDDCTVITDNTGTTVTFPQAYRQYIPALEETTDWNKLLKYYAPMDVSVDILAGSCYLQVYESDNNFIRFPVDKGHWRVEVSTVKINVYKNNVLMYSSIFSLNSMIDVCIQASSQSSIKFKNFCVYPSNIVKAIPLFNCDSIVSSNTNDKVLDNNKCIIFENNNDTLIQCISEDTGGIHFFDLLLHAFAPYTILSDKTVIYCIIYDKHMNTLNNITVNVLKDGNVVDTVVTDHEGICSYKISAAGVYKFTYNIDDDVTEESNTITITNGD